MSLSLHRDLIEGCHTVATKTNQMDCDKLCDRMENDSSCKILTSMVTSRTVVKQLRKCNYPDSLFKLKYSVTCCVCTMAIMDFLHENKSVVYFPIFLPFYVIFLCV